MRRNSWLACRTVTGACAITLLLAGCDSAEPAGPGSPEQPKERVEELRLEPSSHATPTGIVGTGIAAPVVRLTLGGNPAPGRVVQFLVSDGGSLEVASERTDTAGLASPGTWTLGTRAGRQTLTARTAGTGDLLFTAVATAGPMATMDIVAGNLQSAAAGTPLPVPLQVKLADRYGNPTPGLTVSYAVAVGNGTLPGASTTSDSLGIATLGVWTLGSAGFQAVSTSVLGRNVYFNAFACQDPCRGRDLLFVSGDALASLVVDGTSTLLFSPRPGSAASSPAWSPDGRKIAFTLEDYDADWEVSHVALYLMDADGSNAVLRADGFSEPSWSPDGHRLAVNGPAGIYTLSADQDGAPPLLLAEHAAGPAWSPDGTKIAYVDVGDYSLSVMNSDGSGRRVLLTGWPGRYGRPSWSPDGQRLAFTACEGITSSVCAVGTVTAAGTEVTFLTREGIAGNPAWSPDGSRIAVTLYRADLDGQVGLASVPSDGGSTQPIPMDVPGNWPAWRP